MQPKWKLSPQHIRGRGEGSSCECRRALQGQTDLQRRSAWTHWVTAENIPPAAASLCQTAFTGRGVRKARLSDKCWWKKLRGKWEDTASCRPGSAGAHKDVGWLHFFQRYNCQRQLESWTCWSSAHIPKEQSRVFDIPQCTAPTDSPIKLFKKIYNFLLGFSLSLVFDIFLFIKAKLPTSRTRSINNELNIPCFWSSSWKENKLICGHLSDKVDTWGNSATYRAIGIPTFITLIADKVSLRSCPVTQLMQYIYHTKVGY